MRKVAVVGAGGINSWAVKHLQTLIDVYDKKELVYVMIFDNDEVEEKNLLRSNQNFEVSDLMQQKAQTLAKRYNFDYNNTFITEKNIDLLDNFDDIILGVDNNKTRQIIYKFALEKMKYLLDMRAQGTMFSYYELDHSKNMDYYNEKFFSNEEVMNRKGSCQLSTDIENDHLENANRIIAYLGIYAIYFKHIRNEAVATKEYKFAY